MQAGPGALDVGDRSSDVEYRHLDPLLAAFAASPLGDPERAELRERLVLGYLPVVRNVARRYSGRGEPFDDLVQAGCLGLLSAIERFDPRQGHHFLSFAVPTITGEIRHHFRDKTWVMRVPRRVKELQAPINAAVVELSSQLERAPRPSEIASHLRIPVTEVIDSLHSAQAYRPGSLDTPLYKDGGEASLVDTLGQVDPRFELFVASHALAPHLAALPARERDIVIMRFYQDMTQTQIARRIGVSQMHISRILTATLTTLREAVEADRRA